MFTLVYIRYYLYSKLVTSRGFTRLASYNKGFMGK